jgi:hypothetical protein
MLVKPTVKMANHLHICLVLTYLSQKIHMAKIYWSACAHCCDYVHCSALVVGFECVVAVPEPSGNHNLLYTQ